MKNPIIFALDVPTVYEALRYVDLLKDHVGMFKVGLELYLKEGPLIINEIKKNCDNDIFLDLKLHDIPTTVERTMRILSDLGVYMVTVHAQDRNMVKAAINGSKGKVKVLGVTTLTSSKSSTSEIIDNTLKTSSVKGYGVVCPGAYISTIKRNYPDLTVVVPGVRPYKSFVNWLIEKRTNDHRFMITPSKAMRLGADYIVIGRPIRDADDPVKAVKYILYTIDKYGVKYI